MSYNYCCLQYNTSLFILRAGFASRSKEKGEGRNDDNQSTIIVDRSTEEHERRLAAGASEGEDEDMEEGAQRRDHEAPPETEPWERYLPPVDDSSKISVPRIMLRMVLQYIVSVSRLYPRPRSSSSSSSSSSPSSLSLHYQLQHQYHYQIIIIIMIIIRLSSLLLLMYPLECSQALQLTVACTQL